MAHTENNAIRADIYGTSTTTSSIVMTSIIVVVMITIIIRKTFSNKNSDVLLPLQYTIA